MLPSSPSLVLYHGQCIDGFTAAWAAWKALGDTAEYVAVVFGKDEIPDVTGRKVWILDFSYPLAVVETLHAKAKALVVLDHHKTAQDALGALPYCQFDMTRSGAGITWDYFHPGKDRPALVNYVEDRDLWRHALPHSHEVNAAIGSYDHSFEEWDWLHQRLSRELEIVEAEGAALLRNVERYCHSMEKHARIVSFAGFDNIPIVNAPYVNISELVGHLAQKHTSAPFAVGWFQRDDGKFQYSLRSIGDFDVSALARDLGGGGHPRASGFDSTKEPWNIISR